MSEDILDMSKDFEPGDFPCCPICDNEILSYEPACFIVANGSKAAAHAVCVGDRRNELDIQRYNDI